MSSNTDSETAGENPDILVLRRGAHGLSTEEYARALRERLPGYEVVRARTPEEEREHVVDAPNVTGHRFSVDYLDRAENLRVFACAAAGVGFLPLAALEDAAVAVTNASGVHGPCMAEHAVGSILVFVRGFNIAWRRQQRREWRHWRSMHELEGRTVTLVGLGAIGTAIAERLEPFGVHTIGVRYTPEKGGPTDEVIGFDHADVHDALARTEYLVVACPLTDTTRGLIDDEAFETLSPEAVVVNIARGAIVDTDALVSAIRRNAIRGAALDVTDPEPLPDDHPFWTFENILITPHNSGHTPRYYERLAEILAKNVAKIEETGDYTDLDNQVV